MMENSEKFKTIIAYLDRVVINTLSGEIYPTNYFDMRMNFSFLKSIKEYSPDRLILFVNRTVIKTGRKISDHEFWSKMNFIKTGIQNYFRVNQKTIEVKSYYSIAYDWKLGFDQNTAEPFINFIPDFKAEETLFIGPNDGIGQEFCNEYNIKFKKIGDFKDEEN